MDFSQRLYYFDSVLFEVIDNSIPKSWIEVKYKRFHRFVNKEYDFIISANYYQGPKEFLDNKDFLFDVIEYPPTAYEFYKTVAI